MISDKSVEKLLGKLSRDIAQRTPGTGDFPTAVEGLELITMSPQQPMRSVTKACPISAGNIRGCSGNRPRGILLN